MTTLKTNNKILNPFKLPLNGINLIEASAGTGKTHIISLLYIILLLGLSESKYYIRPLLVEEILVVTFTKTATEELRYRILDIIHSLRISCIKKKINNNNPILKDIFEKISDFNLASMLLLNAERHMHEAAIFTIHGFCKRILTNVNFDSSILFNYTIIENESFLLNKVITDFWRINFYPLPIEIVRIIHNYWKSPKHLLKEILPYLKLYFPLIYKKKINNEYILQKHKKNISEIENFKKFWIISNIDIAIEIHKINNKIYNKKNLGFWIKKINKWAHQPTENYSLPKELEKFTISFIQKHTINSEIFNNPLFLAIEIFYKKKKTLYNFFFIMAVTEIRKALKKEKKKNLEIGFDDILIFLEKTLMGIEGKKISKFIRYRYPFAMIDEFQDTNPQQYRIFKKIYANKSDCGLILIGDPKQAIYAFRGADIFTYMRARTEVNNCYTLNTNWRSSPEIINAINNIFQFNPNPFYLKNFKFNPMIPSKKNIGMRLLIKKKYQPALKIWIHPENTVSVSEYKKFMALRCATTIRNLFSAIQKKEAWLEGKNYKKLLKYSDITVIVRNKQEYIFIRDALRELMITSVYISNNDSVFDTTEARELLYILKAILFPKLNNELRCALATSLLCLKAENIDKFNNNLNILNKTIKIFLKFRQIWETYGILPMLRNLIIKYKISENLIASYDERILNNLFHLGELLQEASVKFKTKTALINWLELQIEYPNTHDENQNIRLETDINLVKIITIHKSKGLEFPIVFIPFLADFRKQKHPIFHDRNSYKVQFDFNFSKKSLKKADEERLSEDLRLIYVALTRSIYHCSIGIAPIIHGKKKKISDLHFSGIGYLIQNKQKGDYNFLNIQLKKLANKSGGNICLYKKSINIVSPLKPLSKSYLPLKSKYIYNNYTYIPWKIISYSSLKKPQKKKYIIDFKPKILINEIEKKNINKNYKLTKHNFFRGVLAGKFLHDLFENIDFTISINKNYIIKIMKKNNISDIWLPMIIKWINLVISIPINNNLLSLSCIYNDNKKSELEFYLPIKDKLYAHNFNFICKKYDRISSMCPPLEFNPIVGIIKGFIDLIFYWEGKYYLLDYKSNWLGKDSSAYTQSAMEKSIIYNRYELQYQIYTIALHRYLRNTINNYNYNSDFGGIFYLFLRGLNKKNNNGIFRYKLNYSFIKNFDKLFI